MQVALHEKQIVLVAGVHMRDGVAIPTYVDRMIEAGDAKLAMVFGLRMAIEKMNRLVLMTVLLSAMAISFLLAPGRAMGRL